MGNSENEFEIKKAAIEKGKAPNRVDFIMSDKEFLELKIGEKIIDIAEKTSLLTSAYDHCQEYGLVDTRGGRDLAE